MVFVLPDEGVSPYDIISDPELLDEALNSLSTDEKQMGEVIFKIPIIFAITGIEGSPLFIGIIDNPNIE